MEAADLLDHMPTLAGPLGGDAHLFAEPSHVLTAIGLSRAAARRTLRLGLGRTTTGSDIDLALKMIVGAAAHPLMACTPVGGIDQFR